MCKPNNNAFSSSILKVPQTLSPGYSRTAPYRLEFANSILLSSPNNILMSFVGLQGLQSENLRSFNRSSRCIIEICHCARNLSLYARK